QLWRGEEGGRRLPPLLDRRALCLCEERGQGVRRLAIRRYDDDNVSGAERCRVAPLQLRGYAPREKSRETLGIPLGRPRTVARQALGEAGVARDHGDVLRSDPRGREQCEAGIG